MTRKDPYLIVENLIRNRGQRLGNDARQNSGQCDQMARLFVQCFGHVQQ